MVRGIARDQHAMLAGELAQLGPGVAKGVQLLLGEAAHPGHEGLFLLAVAVARPESTGTRGEAPVQRAIGTYLVPLPGGRALALPSGYAGTCIEPFQTGLSAISAPVNVRHLS